MAASQQHKVDDQPLVFIHHKAVVYPWEYWNKVLVTGCSSWRQPAQIREEVLETGHLFSSSWILPPYRVWLYFILSYYPQMVLLGPSNGHVKKTRFCILPRKSQKRQNHFLTWNRSRLHRANRKGLSRSVPPRLFQRNFLFLIFRFNRIVFDVIY